MGYTILIVDDNPKIYQSLSDNFIDFGIDCCWAEDEAGVMQQMATKDIAAVLLDLSLGKENGLTILEHLHPIYPTVPVIMITGFATLEAAVKAIKIGAYDFLAKPLDFDRLKNTVDQAVRLALSEASDNSGGIGSNQCGLVTQAPQVLAVCRKVRMLAKTDMPVLITGESGCGKELLADLLHQASNRAGNRFLKINCSAFPDNLIDNELFGHEKGAFTGADAAHAGLFEQAHHGTLLLDEIGDLSLNSQTKLLRVLEDGKIRRLGGREDYQVDVRIVASTNRDLSAMIQARTFREDLFYRLNSAYLYLPPLREREGDVLFLAHNFLTLFGENKQPKRFSPEAEALLAAYHWPGNIRELKNVVRLCSALTTQPVIEAEDLPECILAEKPGLPIPSDTLPAAASDGNSSTLDGMAREMIMKTLEDTRYNKKKASQRLGISYKTLFNKMKQYGIK